MQTIEMTSKVWKAQLVMAFMLMLAGICLAFVAERQSEPRYVGAAAGLIGAVWFLLVKAAIWWNHG